MLIVLKREWINNLIVSALFARQGIIPKTYYVQ
jgi:hypothetical protein